MYVRNYQYLNNVTLFRSVCTILLLDLFGRDDVGKHIPVKRISSFLVIFLENCREFPFETAPGWKFDPKYTFIN